MDEVHASIEIDAPPATVFATAIDPDRLADWVSIHKSVSWDSSQELEPGARMSQELHMRGLTFKVNWTLASISEPNCVEWQGTGPATSKAVTRYELSGPADGPTRFDYFNEFHTPGGRLGKLAQRAIVGSAAEREAQKSLEQLKELLENH